MQKEKAAKGASASGQPKKNSAHYMRIKRGALAAEGLVPYEAFVLPENKPLLKQIEMRLRQPVNAGTFNMEMGLGMSTHEQLTTDGLYKALVEAQAQAPSRDMEITLYQGVDPSIQINMTDFGNLPIYVAVVGAQVIVDTVLIDQASITDPVAFNDAVLRSRAMFPLSSIGIEVMPTGETVYNMFGALSSASTPANVITEIYTLAENAKRAIEAFAGFINAAE